jgi:replicative DNA helicase
MEFSRLMDFSRLVDEATTQVPRPMLHFDEFDIKVRGMNRRLVVVAGFSGSFKTTYALNMAYNNAVILGYTSVFVSLEMDTQELWKRLLLRHYVNPKFTKYGMDIKVVSNNWSCLSIEAKRFLREIVAPDLNKGISKDNKRYGDIIILSVQDLMSAKYSIEDLLSTVENTILSSPIKDYYSGIDLLFIDYLQLLSGMVYRRNSLKTDRYQLVGDAIRYLRELTQTYKNGKGINIVALSQINRESFKYVRDSIGKSYDLTSIAESSEIVNAADIIITLRADEKDKAAHRVMAQLLKNRFGETIEEPVDMLSWPEYTYIGNYRQSTQEEIDDAVNSLLGI